MLVLLVEDDHCIAEALVTLLADQDYRVDVATDGEAGWEKSQRFEYDLILLDVMLPKLDGITLCRKLRSQNPTVPILLITSRDNRQDKVRGLDAGADDYVVKPFDIEELAARIRALLRRGSETSSSLLRLGDLCLESNTCQVTYQDIPLSLTPKEYGLLELFLKNRQRVFSHDAILDQLWTFDDAPSENTVRAHIKGLRQKLKAVGAPSDLIETVYGLGYRLNQKFNLKTPTVEPQKISVASSKSHQVIAPVKPQVEAVEVERENQPGASELKKAVAVIWDRFKDKISDRITILEQASTAANEGCLDANLRQQAQQEAHKLAGSLGTFGLAKGSKLAREIEHLFQYSFNLNTSQIVSLSKLVANLRKEVEQRNKTVTSPLDVSSTAPLSLQDSALVWFISDDENLINSLTRETFSQGIEIQNIQDLNQINTLCESSSSTEKPNLILFDLDLYPTYEILAKLTQQNPSIPLVVLTEQDNFKNRVEFARLGGKAFLKKPVNDAEIVKVINTILRQTLTHSAKILIVDDDPHILAALKILLEPKGIQTLTLEDPRIFWKTLESVVPDLLILDIEMPHLNGIELCQVVRTDPRWQRLPIIFLTAHTDAKIKHTVFAAGADDYITKPIREPELINRIFNRLRRKLSI